MSPKHSDYRSEDFGFGPESEPEISYTGNFRIADRRPAARPSNRPLRSRVGKGASHNGIQRRRNKHWSW